MTTLETRTPDRTRPSAWRRVRAMTAFEASLLTRQRSAAVVMLVAPAFLLVFPVMSPPGSDAAWLQLLPSISVLVLLMSIYITSATVLTARRESRVLERLRTSELTTPQMLTSLALPLCVAGALQVAVIIVGYRLLGAPPAHDPLLVVVALAATTVLAVLAGGATSTFAATSERVQVVSVPLLLVGAVAANLVTNPGLGPERWPVLLAPFASCASLVARGLGLPADQLAEIPLPVPAVLLELALTVAWAALFAWVARARWRWSPRD